MTPRETYTRMILSKIYGRVIYSGCRKRETVMRRRLVIMVLRGYEMSYSSIGRVLNIDHASVMYLLKPVVDKELDAFVDKNYAKVRKELRKIMKK